MRLLAAVLLSAVALVTFLGWARDATSRSSARPSPPAAVDELPPGDPRARIEFVELVAPPTEIPREAWGPSHDERLAGLVAENQRLEADLAAERARAERAEAGRQRLEFVFGVRPMLREPTDAERMAALDERLRRGVVEPEQAAEDVLTLANWRASQPVEAPAR